MDTYFGEHLTLDGYQGDEASLNNKDKVLSCLNELPDKLGMHKLSTPEVYHADANEIKDPGGWTGVVVIAESHISVHTFPKRGFVSADVYTCKSGMDTKLIEQFFIETFGLKKIETHFIKRGLEYPKENIY